MRNILNEMNEDAKKIYDNTTKHIESSKLHNKIFKKFKIMETFDLNLNQYQIGKIEKKLFETRNSKQFNKKQTYLYRYHCKDENNDWKIFAFKAKSINEADENLIKKMKNEGYMINELKIKKFESNDTKYAYMSFYKKGDKYFVSYNYDSSSPKDEEIKFKDIPKDVQKLILK